MIAVASIPAVGREVDVAVFCVSAEVALTEAETDVASLMLLGMSNAEIGQRRATSARTVANQVASLFRKLGIVSRSELACLNVPTIIAYAREGTPGSARRETSPQA